MLFEICVEGIDGVIAAQDGGGDRVELCASLLEGGITPSFGTIRAALKLCYLPIHVILRPRGGDFLFDDDEFAVMEVDVETAKSEGADGVEVASEQVGPERLDQLGIGRCVGHGREGSGTPEVSVSLGNGQAIADGSGSAISFGTVNQRAAAPTRAFKVRNARAVALLINSPGGSPGSRT